MPPSAAFLDQLAQGLIDRTDAHAHPEALADALIFLPNRRAARAFSLSLYRALGKTLLAPQIRTLGDVETDEAPDAIGPEALDLPPALPAPRRRGALARLIGVWREAQGEPPLPARSLLAAADELARLLDQSQLGGSVDWSRLDSLAPEADLAEHWRHSADFLSILARAWPKHLKELGVIDPMERRRLAAAQVAARWAKTPPQHPVIIAGSTGVGEATRILMAAVLRLPQGAVVLPGLDPDLETSGWAMIARAPSHPQYALLSTLRALGAQPSRVEPWPASAEKTNAKARRRLINEALAPAEATRGWNKRLVHLARPAGAADLVRDGLKGVTILEAQDESEEALVAALLLRETLERSSATAALIAPEASLGRRVAAIMARWGVEIGPSAGEPLNHTAPGSLILAVMRWARDPADPVALLAVLKHSLAGLGREPETLAPLVGRIETRFLRGPRRWRTLGQFAVHLRSQRHDPEADLIRDLDDLHAPFADDLGAVITDGAGAAEAVARLCEQIAATRQRPSGDRLWTGRAGAMAAQFLEQTAQLSAEMGGVPGESWIALAEALAQQTAVAPETPEHPRIAIWGPLEARLQRRDRIILSGLNEGVWPRASEVDAFLNRRLRRDLGLPDPDERIGLAAHDFAQFANAPEVILLRARRVDGKPAVASRWLWRLRTLSAGGLGDRDAAERALAPHPDHDALAWARALRSAGEVTPAQPPQPRPPVAARKLDDFSPSRVALLIRDPYADYARRILGLKVLRRVGEAPDALARGEAVHNAVDAFEKDKGAGPSLEARIVEGLIAAGAPAELIAFERPLWLRAANVYLRWRAERAPRIRFVETEVESAIVFAAPPGPVKLHAKADRIELLDDGSLAIVDFKTGALITAPQVQTGLEPQLPLEAIIGAAAGFGKIPPAPTSELIYFRLSTASAVDDARNGRPLTFEDASAADVIAATADGFRRLVAAYARADQPYPSLKRAKFAWTSSDYDRLARRGEWTVSEGEE